MKQRHGPQACPYNALYWDFLDRHSASLASNPRMGLMIKQLERIPAEERSAIRASVARHRQAGAGGHPGTPLA